MKKILLISFIIGILMTSGCYSNAKTSTAKSEILSENPINSSIFSSSLEESISNSETKSDSSITSDSSTTGSSTISSEASSSIKEPSSNESSSKTSSTSKASSSSQKPSSSSSNTTKDVKYSLDEWTTFPFYDDYGPCHNPDFEYYYGSSKNPNGVLYTCPNEKAHGDGVAFEKYTQYMISPTFKSWKKVEIRFNLYFASKTSASYKSTKDKPQVLIEKFDLSGKSLGNEEIYLSKSDIPTTGTTYEKKIYIREASMSYYKFKFNNTIANGDSGYTIVVHEVSMKGWDYE